MMSRDIAGSVLANIHHFKNLADILHFPNTKAKIAIELVRNC